MKKLISVIVAFALCLTPVSAQFIPPINVITSGGGGSACPTPVLDSISASASVAYSLRKLRTAYAGSAIRAARTSDSTTQDIGFVGGTTSTCLDLDTTALLSFCAATDCYITIWYDQSGNAQDATGTISTTAAKLVTAGALITTFSAKGSPTFNGSSTVMTGTTSTNYITTSAYSIFVAGYFTAGGSSQCADTFASANNTGLTDNTNNNYGLVFQATGTDSPQICGYLFDTGYKFSAAPYTASTAASFLNRFDASTLKTYVNGGTPGSKAVSTIGTTGSTGIGEGYRTPNFITGYIGEVIYFKTTLSVSDTNIYGANTATYWTLAAWSNIS